jgi:hypothetical protein
MSVSGLAWPLAGLRRLRFSFFSDEPTLSRRYWGILLLDNFGMRGSKSVCFLGL